MAHIDAITAIETYLASVWTATPVIGVLTDTPRPRGDAPFLLVDYPVTNTEMASHGDPGNNVWRDEGTFRIRVHQPKAKSQLAARQSSEIAALFLGKTIGGVQCWGSSEGPLDDENDNGLFYVTSVVVPYDFDHFG